MYGGFPQLSTLDALMHQNLTFDIQQQTFTTSSLINLDASKFFDRIYPDLENISLQILGIHKHIVTIFAETSINTHHQIKTNYGIFPGSFMSPPQKMYSGLGQGNEEEGVSWL